MRLMLGGCWSLSEAADPSGAAFDLGLCSLVLEQPAQVQRCERSAAESKRVNHPFDLLYGSMVSQGLGGFLEKQPGMKG